jgi:hypothetical protein
LNFSKTILPDTEELDLGLKQPKERKEVDTLLKKLSFKKNNSIEQQVVGLGIVQGLSRQITANQLAAKGIKLSIRD